MTPSFRVQSRITPEVFREFAVFDTLRRQKRWRGPLVFALIMLGFAAVCFTQTGRREQAGLLGGVLLTVGIWLPAVYILVFLHSVNQKAKQLQKLKNKAAYTVELSGEGVTVTALGEQTRYAWDGIVLAYRLRRCICLYIAANRGYILPTGDGGDDALWELICAQIPEIKHRDLRKK